MSSRTDAIILIGPPGSGKGSISDVCIKRLSWIQLSTGNLCRKHIAEQTEIGKQIDFAIKSGKLVSDSLVIGMVDEWLQNNIGTVPAIILDGFPRTVAQAKALHETLKERAHTLTPRVIRFVISDENVVSRLSKRYICSDISCQAVYSLASGSTLIPKVEMACDACSSPLTRRKDDEETAIRERLYTYYKHEQDLLNFYNEACYPVLELSVERSLHEVFEDLKKMVGVGLEK